MNSTQKFPRNSFVKKSYISTETSTGNEAKAIRKYEDYFYNPVDYRAKPRILTHENAP